MAALIPFSDPEIGAKPQIFDIFVSEDDQWLFAGATNGFFVANLTTGQVDDWTATIGASVCGRGFNLVQGITMYGTDVFVSLGDTDRTADAEDRFGIAQYDFRVGGTGEGVLALNSSDCVTDGAGGGVDSFPGIYLEWGGRIHYYRDGPESLRLYSCSGTGHLLEISYSSHTGLVPTAYWHNDAHYEELLDCRIYPIGDPVSELHILVAKWLETFAIVKQTIP